MEHSASSSSSPPSSSLIINPTFIIIDHQSNLHPADSVIVYPYSSFINPTFCRPAFGIPSFITILFVFRFSGFGFPVFGFRKIDFPVIEHRNRPSGSIGVMTSPIDEMVHNCFDGASMHVC
jgi:hypothetical protein